MSALGRLPRLLGRLVADDRGVAASMLQASLNWFVVFSTFLAITQMGLLYGQRDAVNHAAAVAADTAMKTHCDKNAVDDAVKQSVIDDLALVGDDNDCNVDIAEEALESVTGGAESSGGRTLTVTVRCEFDCKIPFASHIMCTNGHAVLERAEQTVAMGCDGK